MKTFEFENNVYSPVLGVSIMQSFIDIREHMWTTSVETAIFKMDFVVLQISRDESPASMWNRMIQDHTENTKHMKMDTP